MAQQVVGEEKEKPLGLGEALKIAEKHGYIINAKPIVVKVWNGHLTRGVRLYLPGYIVSIEVDKKTGRASVEVDSSSDCFCSCGSGSGDEFVW